VKISMNFHQFTFEKKASPSYLRCDITDGISTGHLLKSLSGTFPEDSVDAISMALSNRIPSRMGIRS
jgi:hypothetical protein